MSGAVPSAIKALQSSLDRASEPGLRARLSEALRYLRRIYGLPNETDTARDLDTKRRDQFCRSPHRYTPTIGKNGHRIGGDDNDGGFG